MFFFLHIPRTAGTTLNSILARNFRQEEILSVYHREDYEKHREHSTEDLANIRLIQGHLLLQQYDPPLMYGQPVKVFTFLRDPLARLVSEYAFLRSWESNHLYAYLNENNVTFAQYIQSTEKLLLYRGKNFMTRSVSGMDTGGKNYPVRALSRAKRNIEKTFGFVGIQEHFMESLVMLGDFLGIDKLLHEHRNAMKTGVKPVLTDEETAVAEEYNQGDRELYAFACELFAHRVEQGGRELQGRVQALTFLNRKYEKMSGLLMEEADAKEDGPVVKAKNNPWF